MTLAPELPGALEFVESLTKNGVLVSAGHSMANFAEATAGFDTGIRYGTHLFNAMPPLEHRKPGLAGTLLTDNRPVVGFIADGVHTHPAVIKLVWNALGAARLNLVTDAMAALGMGPGTHLLGDYEVFVDDTSCRLANGTLAGSILSLDEALRNLIRFGGCSLEEALPTVTTTPARGSASTTNAARSRPASSPISFCFRPTCACAGRSSKGRSCIITDWTFLPRKVQS